MVPPDCDLTERSPGIPAWDDVADEMKPVLARQMEVYAGYLENTDHHVGPGDRHARGPRDPRRHADLRHHRRQRRLGRGVAAGHVQRDDHPRRVRRARDRRVPVVEDRRVRRARGLQPLRRRLGPRHGHALPVDQAGGVALGRHPQRHDRPLARRDRGQGRDPLAVPPRHRRGPDRARGRRPAAPGAGRRRAAEAHRGREHGVQLRRRRCGRAPRDPVLRDVRQPRHLPQGVDGGDQAPHARGRPATTSCRRPSTTTCGSSTTRPPTGPRPTTWRPSTPTSWPSCSACG